MFQYSIKNKILFIFLIFTVLCKTSSGFAQDEGSDVGVLSLNGSTITSTLKASTGPSYKAFNDKVRLLRVSEGEWDVYFENNGGPYVIPDKELVDEGTYQDIFKAAYANKTQRQVTVDPDKMQILTIGKASPAKAREPASKASYEELPDKYKYMKAILQKNNPSTGN